VILVTAQFWSSWFEFHGTYWDEDLQYSTNTDARNERSNLQLMLAFFCNGLCILHITSHQAITQVSWQGFTGECLNSTTPYIYLLFRPDSLATVSSIYYSSLQRYLPFFHSAFETGSLRISILQHSFNQSFFYIPEYSSLPILVIIFLL